MLSILFHSDGVRFIVYSLLAFGLAGPFLYGVLGPKWWRTEAKEYGNHWLEYHHELRPVSLVKTLIILIEICILLVVAWWTWVHH